MKLAALADGLEKEGERKVGVMTPRCLCGIDGELWYHGLTHKDGLSDSMVVKADRGFGLHVSSCTTGIEKYQLRSTRILFPKLAQHASSAVHQFRGLCEL